MEFSLKEAFWVAAVLSLTPVVLIRSNFFKREFVYQGHVVDAVDEYPLDLVQVSSGSDVTFTDRNGSFVLKKSSLAPSLQLGPILDYETPNSPLFCKLGKSSLLVKDYACEESLYPQPFNLAIRVLGDLIGQDNQTSEVARTRKEKLWNYLSSYSAKIWRDKSYFADLMLPYEETSRRLKALPLSFKVEKKFRKVDHYFYDGYEIKDNLVLVEARLFFTDGRSQKESLYFVKEGKFWKYLLPETPSKVTLFNQKNIWVFNKK